MEFLTHSALPPPRHVYPCLASISLGAPARAAEEEGNALTRVISASRRRTSGEERRKSVGSAGAPAGAGTGATEGTWYWRVQAGASDTHLILLPLTQPPNPLLTTQPAPLSHAMPAHSAILNPAAAQDHSTLGKIKSLLRRVSSSGTKPTHVEPLNGQADTTADAADASAPASAGVLDSIADESPKRDQVGAADTQASLHVDGTAETGWPGVIHGDKLGAVVVGLDNLNKLEVKLHGGKKGEGSWVTVPVNAHSTIPTLGSNIEEPRSGTLKFEFDKDWIGAKGEAELLHFHILKAIEDAASQGFSGTKTSPQPTSVQLGGTTAPSSGNLGSGVNV